MTIVTVLFIIITQFQQHCKHTIYFSPCRSTHMFANRIVFLLRLPSVLIQPSTHFVLCCHLWAPGWDSFEQSLWNCITPLTLKRNNCNTATNSIRWYYSGIYWKHILNHTNIYSSCVPHAWSLLFQTLLKYMLHRRIIINKPYTFWSCCRNQYRIVNHRNRNREATAAAKIAAHCVNETEKENNPTPTSVMLIAADVL